MEIVKYYYVTSDTQLDAALKRFLCLLRCDSNSANNTSNCPTDIVKIDHDKASTPGSNHQIFPATGFY